MSDKLRILLTGFGPFPGAPYNPTQPLVARLAQLRRPALDNVAITSHIFPVTYAAVDRQLPDVLAAQKPDALLMFGLAARTPYLRIETRARNAVTMLWPDAANTRSSKRGIAGHADAMMFGPHTARLLRAARLSGIDARASRDAGAYLCNYLSWRAIENVRAGRAKVGGVHPHSPARAQRRGAAQGGAAHHAGRAGGCGGSDADGDGGVGKEDAEHTGLVGWAKAHLRRAHHLVPICDNVGTLALCPPYCTVLAVNI
ncbi:pyroglutamyl-peptidase [Bradyrhizobium huanghuaihaiense]